MPMLDRVKKLVEDDIFERQEDTDLPLMVAEVANGDDLDADLILEMLLGDDCLDQTVLNEEDDPEYEFYAIVEQSDDDDLDTEIDESDEDLKDADGLLDELEDDVDGEDDVDPDDSEELLGGDDLVERSFWL